MPVRRRRSKRRSIKSSKNIGAYKKLSNRKSNKRYNRTKINKKPEDIEKRVGPTL